MEVVCVRERTLVHHYEHKLNVQDYAPDRTARVHLEVLVACPDVACASGQGARFHLGNMVSTDCTDVL